MYNTNTNTNTNNDQNRNLNSKRGGQGRGGLTSRGRACNSLRNTTIAKYVFEGKMKDGLISKLLIIETEHRPTQFKKIIDTLPVLCTDKNFQGIDEALWTGIDLVVSNFMPTYPDATQWLNTHHVEIQTVAPGAKIDTTTSVRPFVPIVVKQAYVFDTNLQKQLLSQYKRNSKKKSLEYTKFLAKNKALITIIVGQCNEATKNRNCSWSNLHSGPQRSESHQIHQQITNSLFRRR